MEGVSEFYLNTTDPYSALCAIILEIQLFSLALQESSLEMYVLNSLGKQKKVNQQ